jgi:hypothetical protein
MKPLKGRVAKCSARQISRQYLTTTFGPCVNSHGPLSMTAMSTRLGVIYASRWSRVACAAPHSPPPPLPRAWTDNATQDDYWGSFSSMHGVAWRSEARLETPRCCPSAHIGSAAAPFSGLGRGGGAAAKTDFRWCRNGHLCTISFRPQPLRLLREGAKKIPTPLVHPPAQPADARWARATKNVKKPSESILWVM